MLSDKSGIRVLIDRYHDTGWRGVRRNLGGGPMDTTICRETLRWDVLKRYHVAISDASAPLAVHQGEQADVERFVKQGGGLLLAGSAPAFSFVSDDDVADMPAARIAQPFGFRYIAPEKAAGETHWDRDFRLGYTDDQVEMIGTMIEDFGPQPPEIFVWAPIEVPGEAQTLLAHPDTGEVLAAAVEYGRGRVVVCGSELQGFCALRHIAPLINWLAGEAVEPADSEIPTEIGPPAKKRVIHGVRMVCDEPVLDRSESLARVVRRFDEFACDLMGEHWQMPRTIEVLQACKRPRPWEDGLFLAPTGTEAAVAYNTAIALALNALWNSEARHLAVMFFPEATIARHVAIRFLEDQGFDEMAAELREIARQQVDAADPTRDKADLPRVYWPTEQWHPKGLWLLEELENRYGPDYLSRLFQVIPAKQKDDRLPRTFAWGGDRAAYYLSLAAGEKLFPWLQEIGSTLHQLPVVPPDDDGFDDAMRETLVNELQNPSDPTDAARQMEALTDLARLETKKREKLPQEISAKVEAFEASVASDERSLDRLSELAASEEVATAAWAALQLVSAGHRDAADRLKELLPECDARLKLMAGHALRKLGRKAPGASLEDLQDDGQRLGRLEVEHRNLVIIHPNVDGYEVANVVANSGLAVFPQRTYATRYYIDWVYTAPQWRRSGLSRLAFTAAMEHEAARRCSCFALNTGTRNTAHALYADFGYVDMDRREKASKQIALGTPCAPPDGGMVRHMAEDDREAVRRFLRSYHKDAFTLSPRPLPALDDWNFCTLAECDGELIGVALAEIGERDGAQLIDVAVEGDDDGASEVGLALLSRLHGLLAEDGVQRIGADICSDADLFSDVLCRAGYSRRPSGSVNMFGIRDLKALFTEILPLYEHRVQDSDFERWRGRVILLGDRLRGGLEIVDGEAEVIDANPRPQDIVLRTSDATITRMVTGRETPLEGYLQQVTTIDPQVSPAVMKLLETLFPEVPFLVRWGWW